MADKFKEPLFPDNGDKDSESLREILEQARMIAGFDKINQMDKVEGSKEYRELVKPLEDRIKELIQEWKKLKEDEEDIEANLANDATLMESKEGESKYTEDRLNLRQIKDKLKKISIEIERAHLIIEEILNSLKDKVRKTISRRIRESRDFKGKGL